MTSAELQRIVDDARRRRIDGRTLVDEGELSRMVRDAVEVWVRFVLEHGWHGNRDDRETLRRRRAPRVEDERNDSFSWAACARTSASSMTSAARIEDDREKYDTTIDTLLMRTVVVPKTNERYSASSNMGASVRTYLLEASSWQDAV